MDNSRSRAIQKAKKGKKVDVSEVGGAMIRGIPPYLKRAKKQ